MAQYYEDFFTKKGNKDFVLYQEFPPLEALQKYVRKKSEFPLEEVGIFKGRELVEMIKQFCSFHWQEEYQIYTMGITEENTDKEHGWEFKKLIPHMYYLIGNTKSLAPFKEYNGQYINKEKSKSIWYNMESPDAIDIVSIPLAWARDFKDADLFESLTGSLQDKKERINYYDYLDKKYKYCIFSKNIGIFTNQLKNRAFSTGRYGYNSFKDVLSFEIMTADSFLADILTSICIYKYNNGITELTSEDYNHIFETLYGEKVDIIGEAEKDISRTLKYIPSSHEINL